jgi:hypothetical protein
MIIDSDGEDFAIPCSSDEASLFTIEQHRSWRGSIIVTRGGGDTPAEAGKRLAESCFGPACQKAPNLTQYRLICSQQDKPRGMLQLPIERPNYCSKKLFKFTWYSAFRGGYLLNVYGTGEDLDSARSEAKRILSIAREAPFKFETESEVIQPCNVCTHYDIRHLGWSGGNKTDFCKSQGSDFVNYRDASYDDGGACAVGPMCNIIRYADLGR